MIGSLRGRLTFKQAPQIVIECAGVGYELDTPMSTYLELSAIGSELFLYTHLLVREDAQILYGFKSQDERRMFRSLLKVNRVGAKLALGILSAMTIRDFSRCVQLKDKESLLKIPGVGKKMAEQLIIDMPDRIDAVALGGGLATPLTVDASPRNEAIDALVALGYKPREVNKLITDLDTEDKSAEDIIRLALRQVAQ